MYRNQGRSIELLLVEDNPGDIELLKMGLAARQAEFHLHVAEDGEQALKLLMKQTFEEKTPRPDLILLDLNLPKRSGLDVLRIIKSDPDLHTIPVVVLTSSRSPQDVTAAYEEGANSYLQKPKTLDETLDLAETIEHYWLDLAVLPGF